MYAKHQEGNHYSASEQQLFALPKDGESQGAQLSRIIKWESAHVAIWGVNPWENCFLSPGDISNRKINHKTDKNILCLAQEWNTIHCLHSLWSHKSDSRFTSLDIHTWKRSEQPVLIETKILKTRGPILAKCHLDSEFWGDLGSVCSWTEQGLLSQVSESVSRAVSTSDGSL